VLEYDFNPTTTVAMDYQEAGHPVSPFANIFLFEVGMDPKIDSDPNCSHAKDFYNNSTLPFFPGLDPIRNAIDFSNCPVFTPHLYSLRFKNMERVHIFATTLECKSGGLIVTSP
jgi:hypothetical protein